MAPRILLVDNLVEHGEAIKAQFTLRQPDWTCVYERDFESGIAAFERAIAQDEPFAVALVDHDLGPGEPRTGLNLIQQLRMRDPQLFAILYTAMPDVDHDEAFEKGVFDIVEKNSKGKARALELLLKAERALRIRETEEQVKRLSPFFDRRVWGRLMEKGDLLPMKERPVTIAFWDIKGFSHFCGILRKDPEKVRTFLREFGDVAARIIFAHDGVLDKFIGDGVMALFGTLDEGEADDYGALKAAEAALAMRREFTGLVDQHRDEWTIAAGGRAIELGLRCGIHSGQSLVGCVGSAAREQFTALGDNVNIASRFEQAAWKDGKCFILVSDSTRVFLKGRVTTNFFDKIQVKNIEGTFDAYSVEA